MRVTDRDIQVSNGTYFMRKTQKIVASVSWLSLEIYNHPKGFWEQLTLSPLDAPSLIMGKQISEVLPDGVWVSKLDFSEYVGWMVTLYMQVEGIPTTYTFNGAIEQRVWLNLEAMKILDEAFDVLAKILKEQS